MLVSQLVEHGSIHRAARALNISQPAATSMLNDLEERFGFTLFQRGPRGVYPNEKVKLLMDRAKTTLNEFTELATEVERVFLGRDLVLRVGIVPQAYVTYLPEVIALFQARHGCALKTEEGTARQLLSRLCDASLDCVVGRLPEDDLPLGYDVSTLMFSTLYQEEICIVVSSDKQRHPHPAMNYEALREQKWVLQRRDSVVRKSLNEAFLRHGLAPPIPVVETSNYVQSLAIVSRSDLYTVAPRGAAEIQERLGVVSILKFPLNVRPMQVSFINRKSTEAHAAMVLFRQCFVEIVEKSALQVQAQRVQSDTPSAPVEN
jgi:DNA-binding transcriptional LysR family regulator